MSPALLSLFSFVVGAQVSMTIFSPNSTRDDYWFSAIGVFSIILYFYLT